MNTQRLDWIDRLKGFAIFLMVMGHVIAWSFDSFDSIMAGPDKGILVIWRFIYSFHMPLFMFCSGFLFFKGFEWYTIKNVGGQIWKRIQSLLIPYITAGFMIYLYDGSEYKYWFLWYLFLFSVFTAFLLWLIRLLRIRYDKIVLTILLLFISLCCYKIHGLHPLFDDHLTFYLYFCIGIIYRMWSLDGKFMNNNYVYSLSVLVFCVLFCLKIRGIGSIWTSMLIAITGINVFLAYFKYHYQSSSGHWEKLGKYSLQIYILHFFFTVNIPQIGNYLIELNDHYGIASVVVVEFVTSFIISIVVIGLCYLVNEVLGKSGILSRVLLGRGKQ